MLKEEPLSAKYGSKDYLTQPGNARLDTAQDSERLLTCIDNEMQMPAFYEDNKYWLIDEVEKYMKANQEQIAEQRRIIAQQEEEERQRQEEEKALMEQQAAEEAAENESANKGEEDYE